MIRPGYHIVLPPRAHPVGRGTGAYALGGGWSDDNGFDAARMPGTWGMLDCRSLGKAVTGMMDGHVEPQSVEQLRDMRKWSNYATRADWDFVPGP